MSIRVMQWVPDQILPSPVDTHHECRSWKKIDDWAKERSVDTGAEGMIVHPLLGKPPRKLGVAVADVLTWISDRSRVPGRKVLRES